ncbi:ergothioneine biosynthesis glutamate--cysteine ligase EgtA [Krasilnikovia sp. MM14-A1259]|uniref:ergothioneine biosynthesis glutamate--cysteine ligase EgtA n=1 Tax=Krasilnikovia sp. MM14-A1259 TaxID=3373539 RepID=UPI00399C6115
MSGICFKTGPPSRIGVELEFTTHHDDAPDRPLTLEALREALGPYTPDSLAARPAGSCADVPPRPLPGGGVVTVEPGGQLEISSAPAATLAGLQAAVDADLTRLRGLLAGHGLHLGATGIDPYRSPHRLLDSPRYAAMERVFDRAGRHGRTMMCSTAGLQVCLDAGLAPRLADRFAAVTELGPVLVAAFANSRRHAGRDTGWASTRMRAWLGIDPARTRPVGTGADPVGAWIGYAMAAPLLCVRNDDGCWDPPPGVTFADWLGGALPRPPTAADLEYHLSTLFPPVRPRGYLEVRYLDAQPDGEWLAPAAVLAALLADDAVTDAARAAAAPAADRWLPAARAGLADSRVGAAARAVFDLARRALHRAGLPAHLQDRVHAVLDRRLPA